MWAVLAASNRWAHNWRNFSIILITDNSTVQTALSTGKSNSKGIMTLLRKLFWILTEFNFEYMSVYIKSKDNALADALSRINSRRISNV